MSRPHRSPDRTKQHPVTTITIGNSLPEIAAVDAQCRRIAGFARLDADTLADLLLALDEILSNAIRHAFPDGGQHPITVRFHVDEQAIEVAIEYGGVPFDPADAPPPDRDKPLAERRTGGLGLHFTQALMDGLRYCRVGDVNRVTLVKKRAHRRGADSDGPA
ncbi:MAG: ATP-binding protein [Burkholderiaceae bacterium]|nr:ATP-binding protein [Burkholderiaceae bacterium]